MSSWIFFYCAWIYVGFRENGGESKTSNIYWLFCLNIGEIPVYYSSIISSYNTNAPFSHHGVTHKSLLPIL